MAADHSAQQHLMHKRAHPAVPRELRLLLNSDIAFNQCKSAGFLFCRINQPQFAQILPAEIYSRRFMVT